MNICVRVCVCLRVSAYMSVYEGCVCVCVRMSVYIYMSVCIFEECVYI